MSTFSPSVILEGRTRPSPPPVRLFAGPLTLLLEPDSGFIRQIRLGPTILLNGIYCAVRDGNWDTVLPEIRDLKIIQDPGAFKVSFQAICVNDDVHFVWNGHIVGDGHGKITYEFTGEAIAEFSRNRIGFCILHDASAAGHSCTVEHIDGSITESKFPELISSRRPFKSVRSITHELEDGVIAHVRMKGDEFEMEDQRNWTDASYKTYCTPLDEPFPVELQPGDRVEQKVTFEISEFERPEHEQEFNETIRLELTDDPVHIRPRIGFGMASHNIPISQLAIDRLNTLHPDHLRCDLRVYHDGWMTEFEKAKDLSEHLGATLHIALFIDDDGDRQLRKVNSSIELTRVSVILIFHKNQKSTSENWLRLGKELFSEAKAIIVGGSDAYFAEINQSRPVAGCADGVSWSLNPQVHAFDNLSLVETLDQQWETANSARHFATGELMISPVTLLPRRNPNAISEPSPLPIDQLPPQVDPRQMSMLGAAWTLGSIVSLSRSELLRSITYYETTGWRGLMETSAGPKLAHLFVSRPDMVFPMYFVFALIAGRNYVRRVSTSHPSDYVSFQCSAEPNFSNPRILIASYVQRESRVRVPRNFKSKRQLTLDKSNAVNMCRRPEDFLANGWEVFEESIATLGPFGLVAVDGELV